MTKYKQNDYEIHNIQKYINFMEKLEKTKRKPDFCEVCGIPSVNLELKNVNKDFSSNPDDYMYVCENCLNFKKNKIK